MIPGITGVFLIQTQKKNGRRRNTLFEKIMNIGEYTMSNLI